MEEVKTIDPKCASILNNINREVDAIRGYLLDPVDGSFILDEIRHIEELCAALRMQCAEEPAAQEAEEPGNDEELEPDEEGNAGEEAEDPKEEQQ